MMSTLMITTKSPPPFWKNCVLQKGLQWRSFLFFFTTPMALISYKFKKENASIVNFSGDASPTLCYATEGSGNQA